jgi:hypothetical protein
MAIVVAGHVLATVPGFADQATGFVSFVNILIRLIFGGSAGEIYMPEVICHDCHQANWGGMSAGSSFE